MPIYNMSTVVPNPAALVLMMSPLRHSIGLRLAANPGPGPIRLGGKERLCRPTQGNCIHAGSNVADLRSTPRNFLGPLSLASLFMVG